MVADGYRNWNEPQQQVQDVGMLCTESANGTKIATKKRILPHTREQRRLRARGAIQNLNQCKSPSYLCAKNKKNPSPNEMC